MATDLTSTQKHWLLYLRRHYPAACFKIPKVVMEALIRRGYAQRATVPLCPKEGVTLTATGKRFADTGEQ